MQVGIRQTQSGQTQIAPITGNSIGLARAEIKAGIREVVFCKNQDGKLGLRIRHVNNVSSLMIIMYILLCLAEPILSIQVHTLKMCILMLEL